MKMYLFKIVICCDVCATKEIVFFAFIIPSGPFQRSEPIYHFSKQNAYVSIEIYGLYVP